jgi:hypothetical protein
MAGEASYFGDEESFGGGDVGSDMPFAPDDGCGGDEENGSLVVAHISEESAVFCPPALIPKCVSRCATKGRTFGRQKRGRARCMCPEIKKCFLKSLGGTLKYGLFLSVY